MRKKTGTSLALVCLLTFSTALTACQNKQSKTKETTKTTEKTKKDKNNRNDYEKMELYINGKKETVYILNHGNHYHMIYKGKKYFMSPKVFEKLKRPDNKIKVGDHEEKQLTKDIKSPIISYYKHGDHWHVKTADGKEYITYEDPALHDKTIKTKEKKVQTISKKELNNKKIISYYRHGDHWHVKTADGKEYITYQDPAKKNKALKKRETKIAVVKASDLSGKTITHIYRHGDHWHVKTADGKEYITYQDPTGKTNLNQIIINKPTDNSGKITRILKHGDHYHIWIDGQEQVISEADLQKLKQKIKDLPPIENMHGDSQQDFKMHFHGFAKQYQPAETTEIEAHSSKENRIVKYRWSIKKANTNDFTVLDSHTQKVLRIQLTLADHNAVIKVEGLDKNNQVIDSCENRIQVIDNSSTNSLTISGLKDHYHNNDKLNLKVNYSPTKTIKFVWSIKKRGEDYKQVLTSSTNTFTSSFGLDESYHRALIKVSLYQDNNLLTESDPVKIIVNNHSHGPAFEGDPEIGKQQLLAAGFDNRLIYAMMLSEGEYAFPGKKLSASELDQYLKGIKKINLHNFSNALRMKGLEKLTGLESLSISATDTTNKDISILKQFKNLNDLNISGTKITDLSFLNNLPNLEGLSIGGLGDIDLSFLNKTPKIKRLNISDNNINSFKFISNLKDLDTLIMDNCACDNIDFLKNTTKLKKLSLDGNKIKDLSPLRNNRFEVLYLSDTGITDYSSLGNQEDLIAIFANNNQLTSLKAFKQFKNLEYLELENNRITSLEGINDFVLLESLNLNSNPIKSLKINKDNLSLKTLKLNKSALENLQYKNMFKSLTQLEYSNTPALKNELGAIPNVQSNTQGIIYYDGSHYALSHGDHSHIYAGTLKVNPSPVTFKFNNSEIIGFDDTGYYINHKVATLSDGSEYYNIYHITGMPVGAFELPNSMNSKLQTSDKLVAKLLNHRIMTLKQKIASQENKAELLKAFALIEQMANSNEKLIAINKFEKENLKESLSETDKLKQEFENYKDIYEKNKATIAIIDQAYIENLLDVLKGALEKNNLSFIKSQLPKIKAELNKYNLI